tara:strand:- start:4181 stop:4594 length:414 start_codon:yes stop_codon:yes gene_type:complete
VVTTNEKTKWLLDDNKGKNDRDVKKADKKFAARAKEFADLFDDISMIAKSSNISANMQKILREDFNREFILQMLVATYILGAVRGINQSYLTMSGKYDNNQFNKDLDALNKELGIDEPCVKAVEVDSKANANEERST